VITFRCADRIIDADGVSHDFSRRLNNRWYFLCLLAHNASRYGERTTLDQLREIRQFKSRTIGRQIANWFKRDRRIVALAGFESPTNGPYFLKGKVVEIIDGESVFRELGLDIEPRRPRWRNTRIHLDQYVQASALFQRGQILDALTKCKTLLSKKVDWGLRFECGLLLARSYTALGFFDRAKAALEWCTSEKVPEFQARVKITEARINYFAERYTDARRGLDAPSLRNLPWFSQADWYELSSLLEGREFKRLSDQADAEAAGVRAEQRRLRKLAIQAYRRAQKYLEQALSLRLLHGDPHGLQATCFNLGNLIWRIQPSESRAWIRMSEEICERWGVGQDTILPQFVLARLALQDRNPEEAWLRAQQAFDAAHSRDNIFDRATAHRQHARYYLTVGQTASEIRSGLAHALICFKIYTALGLEESLVAFERDFPGRTSEAIQMFGTELKDACRRCAALPALQASSSVRPAITPHHRSP
jgi:tetratricopeptide (TPR) repeat protein